MLDQVNSSCQSWPLSRLKRNNLYASAPRSVYHQWPWHSFQNKVYGVFADATSGRVERVGWNKQASSEPSEAGSVVGRHSQRGSHTHRRHTHTLTRHTDGTQTEQLRVVSERTSAGRVPMDEPHTPIPAIFTQGSLNLATVYSCSYTDCLAYR